MKRRLWIACAICTVLCSACKMAGEYNPKEGSLLDVLEEIVDTPEFDIIYAETEPYPELVKFLIQYYGIPEEYLLETRYYYNYADLDGDGGKEIIAAVIGEYTSESNGESLLILKAEGNGFSIVGTFTAVRTPVIISDIVTNGWHEVIFPVYGGSMEAGYLICHYNSKADSTGYMEEEGLFVDELDDSVAGVQILSNNLIDDLDKGIYLKLAE